MPTFTIDPDNNITALLEVSADTCPECAFSSEKELSQLTVDWPMARLTDVWNGFAGVAPFDDLKAVKKFTSRKAAFSRIWQAVARLSPDRAPQRRCAGQVEVKKPAAKTSRRTGQKGATESTRWRRPK